MRASAIRDYQQPHRSVKDAIFGRLATLRSILAAWLGTCALGCGLGIQALPGLLPLPGSTAQAADDQMPVTSEPQQDASTGVEAAAGSDAQAVEFIATVEDPLPDAQPITVAKGRSIFINTSVPISRIDVIVKEIVRVDVVNPQRLLVVGTGFGVTEIVVWREEEGGGKRHVFEVTVVLDLDWLNSKIAEIDPQGDGHAVSVMGNVLLTGTVSGARVSQQIEELANLYLTRIVGKDLKVQNHLHVAAEQQVILRCIVAEVNRSAIRRLGINGFLAGQNVRDAFLVNQLGGINPIDISADPALATAVIPFSIKGASLQPGTTLSLGFPRAQMQLFIQAMSDNRLLRILAEPTLISVSGETATFLAGGEFPVPVPQSGAATGAITIDYKQFGVRLQFTPLVLPHQRIRLKVRPEVSTRDDAAGVIAAGISVPAISTRWAETTIELDSGATIAIAGLLRDEVRGVVNRIPGIGDIPVLGALFRSVEYQRSQSELVVLVTAEIVASVTPDMLAELPGADLVTPNDLELYLMGRIDGEETLDYTEMPADETEEIGADLGLWQSEPDRLPLHGPWGFAGFDESPKERAARRSN